METDYNGGSMNRAEHRQAASALKAPQLNESTGPSRGPRRAAAWRWASRAQRRNLYGRGRWQRALTANTGRYDFPFANRLDG